jgi:Flp pilus assembly protein TadG
MSTAVTAQPTLTKTPGDVLPIVASFVKELANGDTLTGTPTVSVSPAGPTLSAASVNNATLQVEIEGNKHFALMGQAVQFTMSGGSDGTTYTVTVTVSTTGGRTFSQRPIIVVVSST